eukprot:CAMPEP_0171311866 /NCGR_PEP_ID=MMETSP0816-20121228/22154_1 /TAXON_ID=420281 /ORGANISM="Proboscia inermis, Strain CCAP1064/1" /LENGTH=78 /DNA_ID=CAMNT_0011796915 /DNA_START=481 /DNA_END=717 /DNA_ORIENTATION=+
MVSFAHSVERVCAVGMHVGTELRLESASEGSKPRLLVGMVVLMFVVEGINVNFQGREVPWGVVLTKNDGTVLCDVDGI